METVASVGSQQIAPGASLLLDLHREPNAYVTFHRRGTTRSDWEDLGGCRVDSLTNKLGDPYFQKTLLAPGTYFSVNSMNRPYWFWELDKRTGEKIPYTNSHDLNAVKCTEHNAQFLNAARCDFDFHGQPAERIYRADAELMIRVEQGDIPAPTGTQYSGGGLQIVYKLGDPENDWRPVRATWTNRDRLKRLSSAIARQLSQLGADIGAPTITATMRFPNSTNPTADEATRIVTYRPNILATGLTPLYSLEHLLDAFNEPLNREKKSVAVPTNLIAKETPLGKERRGARQARFNIPLAEVERVIRHRGAIGQGNRNNVAYLLAGLLWQSGKSAAEVATRMGYFGVSQCTPPLSHSEIASNIKRSEVLKAPLCKGTPYSVIRERLKPTRDEADLMPYVCREQYEPRRPTKQQTALRRESIRQIVQGSGLLSCRKMVHALSLRGITSHPSQVKNDYERIGLRIADERRKRS